MTSWLMAYSLPAWRRAGAEGGARRVGQAAVPEATCTPAQAGAALAELANAARRVAASCTQPRRLRDRQQHTGRAAGPAAPPALTHAVVRAVTKGEVVLGVVHILLAIRPHAVGVKLVGIREALHDGQRRVTWCERISAGR